MLQTMALADLHGENTPGHTILQDYHLAVANSGGAILLAGLCCNATPNQMLAFFRNEHEVGKVFHRTGCYWLTSRIGIGPRFSTAKKLQGLDAAFQQFNSANLHRIPMPEVPGGRFPTQLVVVGQHYDLQRMVLFRSHKHKKFAANPTTATLLEAVHASSTAPVNYFDRPAVITNKQSPGIIDKERYWDGGVSGHNNPVMVALTEAIGQGSDSDDKDIDPASIRILSIGSGNTELPLPPPNLDPSLLPLFQQLRKSGIKQDVRKMATAVLQEPTISATFSAHMLLNRLQGVPQLQPGNLVRLNPLLAPLGNSKLGYSYPKIHGDVSDPVMFQRLLDADLAAYRQEDLDAIRAFGEAWINSTANELRVRNQPVIYNSRLDNVVGSNDYASEREHWLRIR